MFKKKKKKKQTSEKRYVWTEEFYPLTCRWIVSKVAREVTIPPCKVHSIPSEFLKQHNNEVTVSHRLQWGYFSLLRFSPCCFCCFYCSYNLIFSEHVQITRHSANASTFLSHLITTLWGRRYYYSILQMAKNQEQMESNWPFFNSFYIHKQRCLSFIFLKHLPVTYGFISMSASLVAQSVKNLPAMRESWVRSLGWEDPREKRKSIYSRILPWRIPWTVWINI